MLTLRAFRLGLSRAMVGSRLARFFCEILASEGWGVEELEQVAFRILQFLVGDSDHAVLVTCICDDLDPRQSAAKASIYQKTISAKSDMSASSASAHGQVHFWSMQNRRY